MAAVPASGQERVESGPRIWKKGPREMHAVVAEKRMDPTAPMSEPGGPRTQRCPSLSPPLLSTQALPLLVSLNRVQRRKNYRPCPQGAQGLGLFFFFSCFKLW